MRRIIMIYGLKRSGNHGIINWLLGQDHFFLFANNIIPIAPIIRGEEIVPKPRAIEPWLKERVFCGRKKLLWPIFKLYPDIWSFAASLEDHSLDTKFFKGESPETAELLILRDPFNLFASRVKKAFNIEHDAYPREIGGELNRTITLWKSHAREFLGETNQLRNAVFVYFNAWFSDQNYRRQISKQLNLRFSDKGFSCVSSIGGGSSFDSTAFDGRSIKMAVLNRRNQLTKRERRLFDDILSDPDLTELAQRVEKMVSGFSQAQI